MDAAYALNRTVPLKGVPKLGEVIRLIAQLGGFLDRKRDGKPGAKTLWLGYVMSPSRLTSCGPFGMGRCVQWYTLDHSQLQRLDHMNPSQYRTGRTKTNTRQLTLAGVRSLSAYPGHTTTRI